MCILLHGFEWELSIRIDRAKHMIDVNECLAAEKPRLAFLEKGFSQDEIFKYLYVGDNYLGYSEAMVKLNSNKINQILQKIKKSAQDGAK